jgi:hypothetical protein
MVGLRAELWLVRPGWWQAAVAGSRVQLCTRLYATGAARRARWNKFLIEKSILRACNPRIACINRVTHTQLCVLYWEQRLGVELARGEASLVLGAVASGQANAEGISGRKASPKWSLTDCQPCVSL